MQELNITETENLHRHNQKGIRKSEIKITKCYT